MLSRLCPKFKWLFTTFSLFTFSPFQLTSTFPWWLCPKGLRCIQHCSMVFFALQNREPFRLDSLNHVPLLLKYVCVFLIVFRRKLIKATKSCRARFPPLENTLLWLPHAPSHGPPSNLKTSLIGPCFSSSSALCLLPTAASFLEIPFSFKSLARTITFHCSFQSLRNPALFCDTSQDISMSIAVFFIYLLLNFLFTLTSKHL